MSITVKAQFESAVTEANEDTFVKSYIEEGTTIIEFDTRRRKYKKIFGVQSKIKWDKETYRVDIKELSTLYCAITYRFIMAQGYYNDSNGNRIFFTPEIEEVSTSKHVSKSVIRLSCYLAVHCGVTLRNIAIIFSEVFLIPIEKSSIKRWIDDIGNNLPSDEEILKKLIKNKMPTECHIDGYFPMGTDNCVMVIKDEHDRILITHEVESENKKDAKEFLQKIKGFGIDIVRAFSDYSKSYTESIKEVFPKAKFQADHFHTAKNIWKHLKKSVLAHRRSVKEKIIKNNSEEENKKLEELASKLWDLRWVLLKKPCNLTNKERKRLRQLKKQDEEGFIKRFRSVLNNVVSIFDKSKTDVSAKEKLTRLRKKVSENKNKHFTKVIKFFDDHWQEAMQYLNDEEDEKLKRGSNSESGMRLLRRLEKNHDGIRSKETRKTYIKIYQTIKYFSGDVANFIDGPIPGG